LEQERRSPTASFSVLVSLAKAFDRIHLGGLMHRSCLSGLHALSFWFWSVGVLQPLSSRVVAQQASVPVQVLRAEQEAASPVDHLSLKVNRVSPKVAGVKIYVFDKSPAVDGHRTYIGTVYFSQNSPQTAGSGESFSVPLPEEAQKYFSKAKDAKLIVEPVAAPSAKLDKTKRLEVKDAKLIAASNASFQ
jgi:hypothetical protein